MNLYLNYLLFSPAVVPDILSQVVASHAENEVVAGSLDQLDQHLQKLVVFLVKPVIREIRYAQNCKYYKKGCEMLFPRKTFDPVLSPVKLGLLLFGNQLSCG